MPYVTERWLGGLLTNFVTVRKSLDRLKELEAMSSDGRHERLTKKEVARLEKERLKLEKNLSGVKGMKTVPDAIFVIDTRKEAIAVAEARKLKVPVVGIVDTNCDPDEVDYVDPGERRRPARHPALRGPHRRRGAGRPRRCARPAAPTRGGREGRRVRGRRGREAPCPPRARAAHAAPPWRPPEAGLRPRSSSPGAAVLGA